MSNKPPSRLLQDGDGHWYLIPVGQETSFYFWVDGQEKAMDWTGGDYSERRINGPHTLVLLDWRDDQ